MLEILEHIVFTVVVIYLINEIRTKGLVKFFGDLLNFAKNKVPGVGALINSEMEKEVEKSVKELLHGEDYSVNKRILEIPKQGLALEEAQKKLDDYSKNDIKASEGKAFAYVYAPDLKEKKDFLQKVFNTFGNKNALSPLVFPSLRRMEVEVISMAGSMLGGDENVVGAMTSGGTESILCAIKTYRDRARKLFNISEPEIVAPQTVHPAFEKACHLFDIKMVHVPIDSKTMQVKVSEMAKVINSNTILLVGSAPQYPHGVLDPISEICDLAKSHNLPVHVDACIGGFMLPWVRAIGYDVPPWNFELPGVTSISADLHKYGYGPKGSSVIVYRNADYRHFQYFAYRGWPGGLFVSPSLLGTRGGGPIAASWACLMILGQEGYKQIAKTVMENKQYLQDEIGKIDSLRVIGNPVMSIVSWTSDKYNVHTIADVMEKKGDFKMERQTSPDSIHMTVMPQHVNTREEFIQRLKEAVETVANNPSLVNEGSAAMYGMVAKIPSDEFCEDFLCKFMGKVFTNKEY